MPESTSAGSAHLDRLHHHRARVAQRRARIDQASRTAATEGYDPSGQSSTDTGPPGAGNESHGRND